MTTSTTRLQYPQPKAAVATLDYSFDWTAWLETGDSIVSASWSIVPCTYAPGGGVFRWGTYTTSAPVTGDCSVVPTTPAVSGGVASCIVSGGQIGSFYALTCVISTANSLTDSRTAILSVTA